MRLPRIVRDVSLQATGGYIGAGLQVVRALVLARLLGPSGLGTVAVVALVIAYTQYADLGVAQALSREIPVSLGAGRKGEAASWRFYGFAAKAVAGTVVAVGLVAYVELFGSGLPGSLRFGLLTAALVVLLQGLLSVEQTVLQAHQRFGANTLLTLALPTASLLTGIAGALIAGVIGVFVGQVVCYVTTVSLGLALGTLARPRRLEWHRLVRLLRIGVPLAVLTFMGYSLVNVDQIVVVSYLGRTQLGVYTIVLYCGTLLIMLPQALAAAVSPRLIRRYGEAQAIESVRELTWRPVRTLSLALPVTIAMLWLVVPLAVDSLLPAYRGSIGPLRVYATGLFFLGLNLGVSSTLIAFRKHVYNIPIIGASIGLNVGADILLVGHAHLGLTGVALGSAVTYAFYWMAHTVLVRHYFGQNVAAALLANLRSGYPGLLLALALACLWRLGQLDAAGGLAFAALAGAVTLLTVARWRLGRGPRESRPAASLSLSEADCQ